MLSSNFNTTAKTNCSNILKYLLVVLVEAAFYSLRPFVWKSLIWIKTIYFFFASVFHYTPQQRHMLGFASQKGWHNINYIFMSLKRKQPSKLEEAEANVVAHEVLDLSMAWHIPLSLSNAKGHFNDILQHNDGNSNPLKLQRY